MPQVPAHPARRRARGDQAPRWSPPPSLKAGPLLDALPASRAAVCAPTLGRAGISVPEVARLRLLLLGAELVAAHRVPGAVLILVPLPVVALVYAAICARVYVATAAARQVPVLSVGGLERHTLASRRGFPSRDRAPACGLVPAPRPVVSIAHNALSPTSVGIRRPIPSRIRAGRWIVGAT